MNTQSSMEALDDSGYMMWALGRMLQAITAGNWMQAAILAEMIADANAEGT